MASTTHLQTKPRKCGHRCDAWGFSQGEPAEVWKCVSGSGLNSAPKARHFNIFREAVMCQTRQNGFGQNHKFFFCQIPMKLNDFSDNLLDDLIDVLGPFKLDWEMCHDSSWGEMCVRAVLKTGRLHLRCVKVCSGSTNSGPSSPRKTIHSHSKYINH